MQRPVSLIIAMVIIAILAAACGGAASAPVAAEPGAVAPGFSSGGVARDGLTEGYDNGLSGAPLDDTLIIRVGSLSLIVKNIDDASGAARTAIEGLGGRLSSSQASSFEDRTSAQAVYRVPATRFDEALAALRALGVRVEDERVESQEVTAQVVDLAARLENLRVTEKALQGIMDRATDIPDVLAVQVQMTEVRGQIEQLTAQKTRLEEQAAMSTISVNFGLDIPESQTTATGWDIGRVIDSTFASLITIGQAAATVGIALIIIGLPVGLVLGLLIGVGAWLWRRYVRRREAVPHAAAGD